MRTKQFNKLLRRTRMSPASRTVAGLRYVLVGGMRPTDAAEKAGVSIAAISRAIKNFPRRVCSRCGSILKVNA